MARISQQASLNLDRAERCWVRALERVNDGDWNRPSGCEDWTVRHLVNHLIGGGARYTKLLSQADPAEVEATRTQNHLGEDPVESFWAHERSFRAVAAECDLSVDVPHRIGPIPGTQLVDMRILELALHSADLSVGTGDPWPIDPHLAAYMATDLSDLIVALGATGGYLPPTVTRDQFGSISDADYVLRVSGRAH